MPMPRAFDYLLDGKPFVACDKRAGRLEMTFYGAIASAKPEDKIVYLETKALRDHFYPPPQQTAPEVRR